MIIDFNILAKQKHRTIDKLDSFIRLVFVYVFFGGEEGEEEGVGDEREKERRGVGCC